MRDRLAPIRKVSKTASPLLSGGIALGLAIGIPVGILLTLGWEFFLGSTLIDEPSELIGLFAALAALCSSSLAFLALNEQRKSRQAGTDPVIIAHLTQRRDAPIMIQLSFTNVGAGAAMNVRINVSPPDSGRTKDMIVDVFEVQSPIRTILQNRSVDYPLHTSPNLFADPKLEPFKADVEYEDIDGNQYSGSFWIDISELEKRAAHKEPEAIIASSLKKLANDFHNFGTETRPLRTVSQSKEERDQETQEMLNRQHNQGDT